MWGEEVYLLRYEDTGQKDEYGNPVKNEIRKQVYADIKSVGQKEFYQANANGFKPEATFILADFLDYEREGFLLHNYRGVLMKYRIIRTYRKNDSLEIVCEGGVNIANTAIGNED